MTEPAHSKWSASGFEQKMLCPGSHVLQMGAPRSTSRYAAEGTAAHQVLTWALQEGKNAIDYEGRTIEADGFLFVVDTEMAEHVQVCIDYVRDIAGDDGVIFADIRVNYSSYLDVPEQEAWGTADVIIAKGDEIIVVDLKYGMGVEVSAERNPQMSLYALGALQAYNGLAGDFARVRMVISQPRIRKAPSEYDLSVEELEAWGRSTARSAVNTCRLAVEFKRDTPVEPALWEETYLRPGEKQCKFCAAKATCPALRDAVATTVFDSTPASPDEFADQSAAKPGAPGYDDAQWLAAALSQADMIEDWCKAVRAEAERRLLAGEQVPGFKVVPGKRGARQWADPAAAEAMLKTFRLKQEQMYDFKLISPTSAEKLAKAEAIGKRQWPKLQELIVQSEGKPHVAPASDPRPALDVRPVRDDFTEVADDLA